MDLSLFLDGAREIAPSIRDLPEEQRGSFIEGCMRGREMERLRIAGDLHDSTGQLLIALRLSIARLNADPFIPAAADFIRELDELARELEEQVRTFAFLNFPAPLREDGLVVALQRLARGFSGKTGLNIVFEDRSLLRAGGGSAALALLRVAQEALTNIYRHAGATSGRVSLERQDDLIRLKITDDGNGLPVGQACSGIGLEAMRQRVAAEGGFLKLRRLRRGTLLVAAVPIARLEDSSPRRKTRSTQ